MRTKPKSKKIFRKKLKKKIFGKLSLIEDSLRDTKNFVTYILLIEIIINK
jgi:hypothetical protein